MRCEYKKRRFLSDEAKILVHTSDKYYEFCGEKIYTILPTDFQGADFLDFNSDFKLFVEVESPYREFEIDIRCDCLKIKVK